MAGLVDCQTEGSDVLVLGFQQCLMGVVDGVFLLDTLAAIPAVLRTTIADQEEDLGCRVLTFQLGYGMADGRAHAGGVEWRHLIDAAFDFVVELLFDVFDDIELDVFAAVAREAVDTIGITDGFEGG